MATDSTVSGGYLRLIEGRFGAPDPQLGMPKDGFLGSEHHNVSAAKFPVGTVVRVYCDALAHTCGEAGGEEGYAEFTYLKHGTNASTVCAAKSLCLQDTLTDWALVTSDWNGAVNDAGKGVMGCVALSAMTANYHGWFWTGGIVPLNYVSALSGSFKTNGNLVIGGMIMVSCSASATIGFDTVADATDVVVGWCTGATDV